MSKRTKATALGVFFTLHDLSLTEFVSSPSLHLHHERKSPTNVLSKRQTCYTDMFARVYLAYNANICGFCLLRSKIFM